MRRLNQLNEVQLLRHREATRWRWVLIGALLTCFAVFAVDVFLGGPQPGSTWSLGYGIAATTLLAVLTLYGARRRTMRFASRRGLGSSRSWLHLHLIAGCLFLILVFMHTGFRLPEGTLLQCLWGTSVATVLSGALGLALQRWIPRVLASGLSIEVLWERIPDLITELRERAEELVSTCDESIQDFYTRQLAPALVAPRRRLIYYFDVTGGIQSRLKDIRYLGSFLSPIEREKLGELEGLFRAKLEIDAHYTLQRALRIWLYAHLPLSIVLVALVFLHLFSVFYY